MLFWSYFSTFPKRLFSLLWLNDTQKFILGMAKSKKTLFNFLRLFLCHQFLVSLKGADSPCRLCCRLLYTFLIHGIWNASSPLSQPWHARWLSLPLCSSWNQPLLNLLPQPSCHLGPPLRIFLHIRALSCELRAGTVARPAGPARTKEWVTLPRAGNEEGTTSLFPGTEHLKYLKTVSLTAKTQHYLRNKHFKAIKSHENTVTMFLLKPTTLCGNNTPWHSQASLRDDESNTHISVPHSCPAANLSL